MKFYWTEKLVGLAFIAICTALLIELSSVNTFCAATVFVLSCATLLMCGCVIVARIQEDNAMRKEVAKIVAMITRQDAERK